jgi:SAC3/GANP family
MMDDAPPPPSNLPFGSPVESSSSNNMDSFFGSETGAGDSTGPQGNNNEALFKLQARIEAKKKKFEQKQLREAAAAASSLRAEAPSFQPSSTVSPAPLGLESVAQRNAIRFADSSDTTTRSHLPQDLLSQSAEVTAAQTALRNSGGRSGRENLENAVSLIGTCEHMCPDEELLRREREGDIQLLERCAPGVIHPANWTLRNTMVKRFRRSAADYKLDVPEWVRPPDVLERVCGYLEEWVMVRILEIH